MTKSVKPATALSEALSTFSKAANAALSAVEDEAREKVARATAEARETKRERDEAVQALKNNISEQKSWSEEISAWRASFEQAELRIRHQSETITQLQREAAQWKDQCLRLQETARQEALDWKDQFLRVDDERKKLALRVDNLVADQIMINPATATPVSHLTRSEPATTIVRTARRPGPLPSPDDPDSPIKQPRASTSRRKAGGKQPSPSRPSSNQFHVLVPPKMPQSRPISPQQQVIRRVRAVFELPIKQEENTSPSVSSSINASRPRARGPPGRRPEPEGVETISDEDELMMRADDNDYNLSDPEPISGSTGKKRKRKIITQPKRAA